MFVAASEAFRLRDEQLKAKVKYYHKESHTNAELDAMTEQVVSELRAMALADRTSVTELDPRAIETELIGQLRGLLEKLFSDQRSTFLAHKMERIQRKISQLFFNSELYAHLAENGATVPAAEWASQVLYFALEQAKDVVEVAIFDIPAKSQDLKDEALERFRSFQKSLCNEFLAQTTPELEHLLRIFQRTYMDFFLKDLPRDLPDLAWEVIRESRAAENHGLGYKLTVNKFPAFRESFDRKFLERLVLGTQQKVEQEVENSGATFRDATLRFVTNPEIHAAVCSVINDAMYEYLHSEGFLDLPADWKSALHASA